MDRIQEIARNLPKGDYRKGEDEFCSIKEEYIEFKLVKVGMRFVRIYLYEDIKYMTYFTDYLGWVIFDDYYIFSASNMSNDSKDISTVVVLDNVNEINKFTEEKILPEFEEIFDWFILQFNNPKSACLE